MTGTNVYGVEGEEFEVGEFLAGGGFGKVFKARGKNDGQPLALKTITPPSDEVSLKVFQNEGKLAMGICHPNVVNYIYFHDGTELEKLPPYILMEYADGGTVRDMLTRARSEKEAFFERRASCAVSSNGRWNAGN